MKDIWTTRLEELRIGYGYYRLDVRTGRQYLAYSFEYTNLPEPGPLVIPNDNSARHPPRKGDFVYYEGDVGVIAWTAGEDIYVNFNGNTESFDRDVFNHYKTPRGRTTWYL